MIKLYFIVTIIAIYYDQGCPKYTISPRLTPLELYLSVVEHNTHKWSEWVPAGDTKAELTHSGR